MTDENKSNTRAYWVLHLIILLSSVIPSIVKLVELEALVILFYRTLFAFLLLGVFLWWRKMPQPPTWRERLSIIGSGGLVFLYWGLTFVATKISNASVCLVGMSTASLWITFLDPIISNRARRPFQVLVGMNAILGIYIIANSGFDYGWGLTLAIVGAFFGALLTIYNAKMSVSTNSYVITYYQVLGAVICTSIFLPIYAEYLTDESHTINMMGSVMDFALIFVLALVISILVYSLSIEVMKVIPPFTVALVSNLNPIYGTLTALVLFQKEEVMTAGFYLGTALLLFSVFAFPVLNHYVQKYKEEEAAQLENEMAAKTNPNTPTDTPND
jgi:drug/metabolite transporter (DMT)-like permease